MSLSKNILVTYTCKKIGDIWNEQI
jgi:hypothetical protein